MVKKQWSKGLTLVGLIALALALAGCGEIQDAINDLKTQNVDFYQGFYDGAPQRVFRDIAVAQDVTLMDAGSPRETSINDYSELSENVAAVNAGIDQVRFSLSGHVENLENASGRLYVFFAPTSTPSESEARQIGSVHLGPYEAKDLADSTGFEQSPEEIEANVVDYFTTHSDRTEYHVFLWADGIGGIQTDSLVLSVTPAFAKARVIPASIVASYSQDSVKDIVSVELTGTFSNLGNAPARFVWVVGHTDEELTIDSHAILDAVVQPGEKIECQSALVEDGLKSLKGYLKDLADGQNVAATLFVVSDDIVTVDVRKFRVEFQAEVEIF